jgi:AraC-like DNA-binding protein
METITPVYYDGAVIAFVQLGQFRDETGEYSSLTKVKATAKAYGLDEKLLMREFRKLPIVSKERLRATLRILESLVTSFWEKGLVYADRSMLSLKIERFVEAHLTEDLQVEDLCKEFFLSRNALYRLFNTQFRKPVKEFVLQKRMQYAEKVLLSEPQLSIAQVAAHCGFSDYNYFIRAFGKIHNLTPLQYRKSAVKNAVKEYPQTQE